MTKTPPSSLDPMNVAKLAGAASSGWLRVGDGGWTGTVTTKEGKELTVDQVKTGWKVSDETGISTTAADLAVALRKAGVK